MERHSFRDRPKLCGNCAFPQNFHTKKLGEITVFYAVCVELINFYSPGNHQKTYGFPMNLGVLQVNWFIQIRLILEKKFSNDPLLSFYAVKALADYIQLDWMGKCREITCAWLFQEKKKKVVKSIKEILKLVPGTFHQVFIFSPNDSPSKTIKKVFYFIEKALFVLKVFKFL